MSSMTDDHAAPPAPAPDGVRALTFDVQGTCADFCQPLLRMAITFMEIFPVGLLVALVSALVLRNPRVLPAKAA